MGAAAFLYPRAMRLALAAAVAGLALVAAGCGSDDGGGGSATEEWADGLCTALSTWSDSVQAVGATLQDTTSLSVDSVRGAIEDVVDATSTLASDVQELGRPDTEAGQEAEETVTRLADTLEQDAATLEQALEGSSGATGLLENISTITTTLGSMASAVGQAFTDLEGLDAADELRTAFESADSCADLAGSGS
jgi:hypothetical protein